MVSFREKSYTPGRGFWKTGLNGFLRLIRADRLQPSGNGIRYLRYLDDFSIQKVTNIWTDTITAGFSANKVYVVETLASVVQRCLLMTTDPGELVLDPTCGSGTTAYVAEQWGRRWITIDTSRVALALRYPYYLLADSRDGQLKEAEVTRSEPFTAPARGDIRQGFVYERVPHITLKSIANNAEIDIIWEKFQQVLEPLREKLNTVLGKTWEEWEIPRNAEPKWSSDTKELHARWWKDLGTRQKEIDASIAAKAEYEYLYDKPYEDNRKVRVAGPFTVESVSPHRTLGVDESDDLIDPLAFSASETRDFASTILENLKAAGVQQAHKVDKIVFSMAVIYKKNKIGKILAGVGAVSVGHF